MTPEPTTGRRGSWRVHLVCLALLAAQALVAFLSWTPTEELRAAVRSEDPGRMARALPVLAMRGDPETFTPALLTRLFTSEHPVVRELAYCNELTRYVGGRLVKRHLLAIQDRDELRRCKFWMKKLGTGRINLTLQGLRWFLNAIDEIEETDETDAPDGADEEGPP